MKKFYFFIFSLAVFGFVVSSVAYGQNMEDRVKKQILESINSINESNNVAQQGRSLSASADFWPTTYQSGAASATFAWGASYESFKIYIWRENGDAWVEIDPQGGSTPFICGASFTIVQGGTEFDTVNFETYGGGSQCDNISTTSIYKFTQWSFYESKADLNQAFTLSYDGASAGIFSMDVPAAGATPPGPSANSCAATFDLLTGIVHVPCFDLGGVRYQFDLGIASGDPLMFYLIPESVSLVQ